MSAAELLILGAGAVVEEYYLPALSAMGRLPSVTVADLDEDALSRLRQRFPAAGCERADYTEVLAGRGAASDNTVAIVALPTGLHVAASAKALENGFHVLCEKPLALAAEDCRRLAAIAAERRRQLWVAMSRRYLPSLMAARELVQAGELGRIRRIEVADRAPFRWRPRSFSFFDKRAGGILADMGVHYLDYLQTLVGPLQPVAYEDDRRGGVESALTYRLRAGEVPISMRLSRLDDWGGELAIECDNGTIRVRKDDEADILVEPACGGKARCLRLQRPFTEERWPLDYHGSFCEMLADLDRAVHGGLSQLPDIREAEATTGLIEWAYQQTSRGPAKAAEAAAEWLITGATGFIGGHLLERLHTRNDGAVRITARSPGSCANVARYPVKIAPMELLRREQVEDAVAGARIVFHLAYGRDGRDASQATIRGTRNVVNAAIASGAEAVVVLSTMYVFGFPTDVETVDEDAPYRPYGGEYGRSKAGMERWCLQRAQSSGATRIVVLNPTCVFGPRGGAYTTLPVELARQRRFCWLDEGRGWCNYTYVENLVDAILLAAENPAAGGRRFIVSDGAVSWREFLEPFLAPLQLDIPNRTRAELEGMWVDEPRFPVADMARAMIGCPEVRLVMKRSKILARLRGILRHSGLANGAASPDPFAEPGASEERPPPWLAELYPDNRVRFSAQRARDTLGWSPRISLEAARDTTRSWLRDAGFYRGAGCSAG
jgi:predicted dehydrogenase/nucleoside-diphosphate-sugar epimerase